MNRLLLGFICCFLMGCQSEEARISTETTGTISTKESLAKKTRQEGDIIFHISKSRQSEAIQIATNSKYSHMGILYQQNKQWYVYEAVQPVKLTPIQQWINRGKNKHYVIKRLKNAQEVLRPAVLKKMKKVGQNYLGKDYDIFFEWSDERIYCSELVWKIYKQAANIEIGRPQAISKFDLSHPSIQKIIQQRYGNKVPQQAKIISPAAMFESELLEVVKEK